MTINDIKKYTDEYVIQNGNVYLKSNNQQVLDEDTILKVKSARLIYNEAREKYQSDAQQFGKPNGDFPKYVSKMMEQLSVNGEVNTYGTNKLINSLLSSSGHYEEYMSGDDLSNSKFSMLVGVKQDYGLAYLKLKFREKGLDIDSINIKQDLSELKHNGVSKVILDFQVKKYEKRDTATIQQPEVQSVQNNITSQKTVETTTSLYEKMINALKKSRTNNLTEEEKKQIVGKIYYYEGFLVESVKDEKSVGEIITNAMQDFSNTQFEQSILNSLVSELQERLKVIAQKQKEESKNYNNINNNDFLSNINNMRQEMNRLSIEYKQMLSDGMIDDQELDYLIAIMQDLYRNAMSLKANNLSSKEYQIINEIVASISKEQSKMTGLRDGIEKSVQHFGR